MFTPTPIRLEDRITDSRYWLQALTKATSDLKDALKNTSQITYPIQTWGLRYRRFAYRSESPASRLSAEC